MTEIIPLRSVVSRIIWLRGKKVLLDRDLAALLLASHEQLGHKLEEMEMKYDERFRVVFEAIQKLMAEPEQSATLRNQRKSRINGLTVLVLRKYRNPNMLRPRAFFYQPLYEVLKWSAILSKTSQIGSYRRTGFFVFWGIGENAALEKITVSEAGRGQ